MTAKDNLIEAFTELAPRYEEVVDDELRKFWGWSYGRFVEKLIEFTPIRKNDVILDVATGTAVIPLRLTEHHGSWGQIVGLDITLNMLKNGKKKIEAEKAPPNIDLTCATAMAMPFNRNSFDIVICGLAAHHMGVRQLLSEINRVLKTGGRLTIADVGGSPLWRFPGIKALLRIATFLYFLATENITRAWTESAAVSNVHSADEWYALLAERGFTEINITKLSSNHFWIPSPLVTRATKNNKG